LINYWQSFLARQNFWYKILLFVLVSGLILYLLPKNPSFQYEYQKGLFWPHENYYAPFDFPLLKSEAALEAERAEIISKAETYLRVDPAVVTEAQTKFTALFDTYFPMLVESPDRQTVLEYGLTWLSKIYAEGVLPLDMALPSDARLRLIEGNTDRGIELEELVRIEALKNKMAQEIDPVYLEYLENFYRLFFEVVTPNISLDRAFSDAVRDSALEAIVPSRGLVSKGSLVISKDELIDDQKFARLESLENEFNLQGGADQNQWQRGIGFALLVGLSLLFLFRFLAIYRPLIYQNNKELTFIVFNLVLVIFLTVITVNYNSALVYVVPICILPLILKAFFDPRLGLLTHVITILLLGFVVPNSFEFVFIQFNAGMITLQGNTKLHQRASLFISVGQIVGVYLLSYLAFHAIHELTFNELNLVVVGLFILNGLITLFVQPLIYLYEKLFVLTSDVSLLELSDTNSPLLKTLSEEAPGTFHHVLQVANLAEAAANKINANSLLVRVGALYHDIGKLERPTYFSENQKGTRSPHSDLTPHESAQIILAHVQAGVALAKKHKLPERVIDFICTHHGTTTVYYFLKQAEAEGPVDTDAFRYPGPRPFSKETAIVMMADAVEAASKSLKSPDFEQISSFVHTLIDRQRDEGQFDVCAITLNEIAQVKTVLIDKLSNIYHLRVAYPK